MYKLPIHETYDNPISIKKAILQGPVMENYIRPAVINLQILNKRGEIPESRMTSCRCDCKCDSKQDLKKECKCDSESFQNKFAIGFLEYFEELYSQVEIIKEVIDDEYDQLMIENIIMIELIDASACNTVIESILRCTPILINKIPPVIEYLGDDYPFYYGCFQEAAKKAVDLDIIRETHEYLLKKDKTFLSPEHFIKTFVEFINTIEM